MRALLSVVVLLVALSCRGGTSAGEEAPEISAQDVHHFVAAFKQLSPSDTTCAPLAGYLSQQSRGLRAYRRKFEVGQSDICEAIRRSPERYAALESKLGALDSATSLIRAVFDKFSALHPLGKMPGVYFVVGNGISGGTTTRLIDPIILIGMELNRSTEGLSGLIAHELVHTQQDYPLLGSMTGGPKLLRGSVLRHSIKEGSANFLAELMTGQPHRHAYGEAHEAQLWAEFRREASSKDYSRWLYNGWNKSLGDRPPDLGYWMGYRITKSYFAQAADKRQAISDILSIKDFDRFLAASGYAGGTRTPGRPGFED